MNNLRKNWPAGIKKTRQRENVMAILESAKMPLSATDICSRMEEYDDAVWLSTVYRVLELFVQKGIVIKTSTLNSEMAVYELNRSKHKHYAVCMSCHKMIEMDNCPLEKFVPKLEEENFQVLGHNLEIFGYCKDCSPDGN